MSGLLYTLRCGSAYCIWFCLALGVSEWNPSVWLHCHEKQRAFMGFILLAGNFRPEIENFRNDTGPSRAPQHILILGNGTVVDRQPDVLEPSLRLWVFLEKTYEQIKFSARLRYPEKLPQNILRPLKVIERFNTYNLCEITIRFRNVLCLAAMEPHVGV